MRMTNLTPKKISKKPVKKVVKNIKKSNPSNKESGQKIAKKETLVRAVISRQQDIAEATLGSPETVSETKLEILKGKNDFCV